MNHNTGSGTESNFRGTDLNRNADAAWEPQVWSPEHPWTLRDSAHLLRRAGWGGSPGEIVTAQQAGMEATIDRLFDVRGQQTLSADMETAGRLVSGGEDARPLSAWWLLQMVKSEQPLLEKLTLFWHGHFATGADKVKNSRAMFRQHQLLRQQALGPYEDLVKAISRDVAMLIYLDSEENRKTRPNENYARELLELFCLGTGNYSESDIKEIARCFTGWTIRRGKFRFDPYQHDTGVKSFLGAEGNYDGNEAVEVVLQQPAAATFIAKKLIRFYVTDALPISDGLAKPIADTLRRTGFQIEPALRQILCSRYFYSDSARAQKVKSPVELAVGFLRYFGASSNMTTLQSRLAELGQLPLYPPNVSGWDGGREWINAATILARANLISGLLRDPSTHFEAGSLEAWFGDQQAMLQREDAWLGNWPNMWEATLLAVPLPPKLGLAPLPADRSAAVALLAALPEFQIN